MAKKKEKTSEELVMEIMTKIKNVFKKDIYIKDGMYIFGGDFSDEDISGDIVCVLEPEFIRAVSDFFEEKTKLIYVDDVAEFKKDPSSHIVYEDDADGLYRSLEDIQKRVNERLNSCEHWRCMLEQPEDVLVTIFDGNSFVNLKDREGVPFITIGKRLFPLVTLKNVGNMMYSIDPYNNGDLYTMSSKFQFTHFLVQSVYYFLEINEYN